MSDTKLPPLEADAFDGEKYEAPIPKNNPLPKCTHKDVTYDNAKAELRCSCGAAWTGQNIGHLYTLLKHQ